MSTMEPAPVCSQCHRLIVQLPDGSWDHIGEPKPRHIATPVMVLPAPPRPDFFGDVEAELQRAQQAYPPLNSLHEAYAVLLEELEEVWTEVRMRPGRRSTGALYRELVQLAAMCARTVHDLKVEP